MLCPLTHPTTHPRDYWGGDTKRGEGSLIKVKKQVDFKIPLSGCYKKYWYLYSRIFEENLSRKYSTVKSLSIQDVVLSIYTTNG